jgi:CheY-like chemotaxis protein
MRAPVHIAAGGADCSDVREMTISEPISTATAAVLVVDDHEEALRGICGLVERTSGVVLVGAARSGEAAVALVGKVQPDVVLMDVRMPGLDGIAATRAIKAMTQSTVVILVSTTHPDDLSHEARACGADDVVWKGDLRRGVLEQVVRRHTGQGVALAEHQR